MTNLAIAETTNNDRRDNYQGLLARYRSLELRIKDMETRLAEAQRTADIHLSRYVDTKCETFVLEAQNARLMEAIKRMETELRGLLFDGFASVDVILGRREGGEVVAIVKEEKQ